MWFCKILRNLFLSFDSSLFNFRDIPKSLYDMFTIGAPLLGNTLRRPPQKYSIMRL